MHNKGYIFVLRFLFFYEYDRQIIIFFFANIKEKKPMIVDRLYD